MQQTHKRGFYIFIATIILIGGSVGWYRWPFRASQADVSLYAPVKQGTFRILVMSTGELQSSKSVNITGPTQARAAGIYQSKISSIVPVGTVVKTGDIIAELDRTPVATQMSSAMLDLQKAQAAYTGAELDSALDLEQARDAIRSAEDGLEKQKLIKDEAQYEAPMVKQQAELDYKTAARGADQAKRNLAIKTEQDIAKISAVSADLSRQQDVLKRIQEVSEAFTVKAPAPGMVIYDGGVGSDWNAWNPTVAMLPDLTQMESDTYINEVDIRQISVGQKVQIALDAAPSKKLDGIVTKIANVGEQRPNQDAKVFKVKIQVVTPDTTLRPGMTTENSIEIASIPNVASVPLEALVNQDGFSYVYKEDGGRVIKRMIEPGAANDNEIVVLRGLTKDDRVLLAVPADTTGIRTEIIPGLKPIGARIPSAAARPKARTP